MRVLTRRVTEFASQYWDDLPPRGLRDVEWSLYEKTLVDAVDFGMNKIQPHFQGEPLLYKRFSDMVRAAKAKGLYTQAFTTDPLLPERRRGR